MKINFKVTTDCPANCKCCQERLSNFKLNRKRFVPKNDIYEHILRLISECGDAENSISITGGEPTMIAELPAIVKLFTQRNIRTGIDTNGWNVTDSWLNDMEQAQLDYILLSFYSPKEKIFEMLRGSENTELFLRASNALSALKRGKEAGGKIKIRQQVTLMKPNYKDLPDLLRLAIDCRFNALSTAYYIAAVEDPVLTMDEADIMFMKEKVVGQLRDILCESGMNEVLLAENLQRLTQFFTFKGAVPINQVANGYYRNQHEMCYDKNRLVIYPNGDVVPCTGYDYIMNRMDSVNIMNSTYKQIMESPLFSAFWTKPFPLCERCSAGNQIWLDLSEGSI